MATAIEIQKEVKVTDKKVIRYPGLVTTTDGSGAVVWVESHISQGACAYPITPSTPMGDGFAVEFANGTKNLWGEPVVFLEPSRLYRRFKEEVVDHGEPLPLDKAFVVREGTDVTLVAWGAMLHESLKAADELAADGHFAEVIDLATLKPIDYDTVLASVKKTGRCVVVTEAPRTASLASEISANISEQALLSLLAPVARVTAWDTVTPMFRLEEHYMPNGTRIAAAARKVLKYQ